MKHLLIKLADLLINLYTLFYFSLFATNYSFMLKKPLSNIATFSGFFLGLLAARWFIDKKTFFQIAIFKAARALAKLKDSALLSLAFFLLNSSIIAQGIARHMSLSSRGFDMGIFDQAVWNTLRGDILFSSIRGNFNLMGDHFEPVLFLLAPFYAVFAHPFTLIIVQSAVLSLAIFPLYWIAREKLPGRFLVFSLVISYILNRSVRGIGLSDFHPESFMVMFSFCAFYYLVKNRLFLFVVFCLLILACKETAVFIIIGLGLYALFTLKKRFTGGALVFAGIAAWIIETKVVMPVFSNSQGYIYYARMPFGNSYAENISFVLHHPLQFLAFVFMPAKIDYCFRLLGPLAYIPLFAPGEFPLVIAPLITMLLGSSSHIGYYLTSSHYVGHVLAFVYIGGIYGAANLLGFIKERKSLAPWIKKRCAFIFGLLIIIFSLFFHGKTDAHKFQKFIDGIQASRSAQRLSYLKMIPKEATVSATSNLVPHLAHRKFIYDLGEKNEPDFTLKVEYLVIDYSFFDQKISDKDATNAKILQQGYRMLFSGPEGENSLFIFINPNADRGQLERFKGNIGI